MPQGNPEQIFPIFFGVWVVLGLFSAGFFFLNKNSALKRKVWPPFVIVTGLLFIGFTLAMGIPSDALYIMLPAVVLITVLNLKAVQFCDSCGATIMSQNPLAKPEFCSKCGSKLGLRE